MFNTLSYSCTQKKNKGSPPVTQPLSSQFMTFGSSYWLLGLLALGGYRYLQTTQQLNVRLQILRNINVFYQRHKNGQYPWPFSTVQGEPIPLKVLPTVWDLTIKKKKNTNIQIYLQNLCRWPALTR